MLMETIFQSVVDLSDLDIYNIKIYFYKLDDSGLVDSATTDESTCKMRRCILPNVDFCGIWESLVFQEPIKEMVIICPLNMQLVFITDVYFILKYVCHSY